MQHHADQSRGIGDGFERHLNAKTIVPGSDWGAKALLGAARTVSALPSGLTQRLARLNAKGVRLYDTMPLPD